MITKNHEIWLKSAYSSLLVSKRLCIDNDVDTLEGAAFHTQQCAEKALKAYLLFHKEPVYYKADLRYLLDLCIVHETDFEELLPITLDLMPYEAYSRYPEDDFTVDYTDVLEAIEKAAKIFKFVKDKCSSLPDPNQTIF